MTLDVKADHKHESDDPGAVSQTATSVIDDLIIFCSGRDRISVGEVVDRLGASGFAVLILVLVLPPLIPIPGPYGIIFGTVVAILAVQMILGRQRPWLPPFLTRRTISTEVLTRGSSSVRVWLAWIESFHSPGRMRPLMGRRMIWIAGCVILPLSVMIGLPIPFGNLPPVLAIVMIALALISKDGIALMIAFVAAAFAAAWVGGMLWFGGELLARFWPTLS